MAARKGRRLDGTLKKGYTINKLGNVVKAKPEATRHYKPDRRRK